MPSQNSLHCTGTADWAQRFAMGGLVFGSCLIGFTAEPTPPVTAVVKQGETIPSEAEQRRWEETVRSATERLKEGDNESLYSQRGDALFFLGRFKEAVADYDQMVTLNPQLDASHWRRGIAYFYAGRFTDAAGQFERYHSFDDIDRENGIWRYLSQVKAHGREKARAGLLKYQKDDREPFPAVYALFSGQTTPDKIREQIAAAQIDPEECQKREFYAELYIGLNEVVEGRPEAAAVALQRMVKNPWGRRAGYGPHYMWQVGRLQLALLQAAKSPKEKE